MFFYDDRSFPDKSNAYNHLFHNINGGVALMRQLALGPRGAGAGRSGSGCTGVDPGGGGGAALASLGLCRGWAG